MLQLSAGVLVHPVRLKRARVINAFEDENFADTLVVKDVRITSLKRLVGAKKSFTIKVNQVIRRFRNPNLCFPRNPPKKLSQILPCEK